MKTTILSTLTLTALFSLPTAYAARPATDSVNDGGLKSYMTTTSSKSPIDPSSAPVAKPKPTARLMDDLRARYSIEEHWENNTADLMNGYSKTLDWDRMIPPYALEVTYDKTVHIIFPGPIRYVDLGNESIIAGIAGDLDNVLRVKAAVPFFELETNLAVATEDGRYYSFNVKYADEPLKLNVEMHDFIHDGNSVNRPNNSLELFLHELQNESPTIVRIVMQSIHEQNSRLIRHIGSKSFGIQFTCKGIYTYNNMIYFHLEIRNSSSVPFNLDYLTFKILDRQLVRRTTIQETEIFPVRAYNYMQTVRPKETVSTVFAFPIFTVPREKVLRVDLHEMLGGRNQIFDIETYDFVHAKDLQEFARFVID